MEDLASLKIIADNSLNYLYRNKTVSYSNTYKVFGYEFRQAVAGLETWKYHRSSSFFAERLNKRYEVDVCEGIMESADIVFRTHLGNCCEKSCVTFCFLAIDHNLKQKFPFKKIYLVEGYGASFDHTFIT